MFLNVHSNPGKSVYTVAVTNAPVGTAPENTDYDEVDVIAASRAEVPAVIAAADLDGYENCRVVGVIDQSAGCILAEKWDGDLRDG